MLEFHINCTKHKFKKIPFFLLLQIFQTWNIRVTVETKTFDDQHFWASQVKQLNLPPPAIVALISESSSSSPLMASCKWRGVIRLTFKSLEALPANSRTFELKKILASIQKNANHSKQQND